MSSVDERIERVSRGNERTCRRLLDAAEHVFGTRGYHDASISEITQRAGVAQGTFYVHFPSKLECFQSLVRDRMAELRATMRRSTRGLATRADIESAGFRAFFTWIAEHPQIYRVGRQAEFVDPSLLADFYRIFSEDYQLALSHVMDSGEMRRTDPEVLAWCMMGMADFVAMRWIVWEQGKTIPGDKLDAFLAIARRSLGLADV